MFAFVEVPKEVRELEKALEDFMLTVGTLERIRDTLVRTSNASRKDDEGTFLQGAALVEKLNMAIEILKSTL